MASQIVAATIEKQDQETNLIENFSFDGLRGGVELRVREVLPEWRNNRLPEPELDLGLKEIENLSAKLLLLEDVDGRALELRSR